MLTQRRADILNLVVDEYIDTATPVSSKALVDRHNLRFSSATVRSELAHLEADGFITQPYTSAGRVPSNVGYRFYVERLMSEEPIGREERRTIEHQFHQAAPGYDDWLQLASSILASAVGNVAVVSRPQQAVPRLRHAQLVELRPGAALMIAVMDDGSIRERIVQVPEVETQAGLTERADAINARCSHGSAATARAFAAELEDETDRQLALDVAELVDEHALAADLYIEGIRSALAQPEFASTDRILDAVQHLEAYHLRDALRLEPGRQVGARHQHRRREPRRVAARLDRRDLGLRRARGHRRRGRSPRSDPHALRPHDPARALRRRTDGRPAAGA